MRKLRVLNDKGQTLFKDYIEFIKYEDGAKTPPYELLDDSETSESFGYEIYVEERKILSKYESALYFSDIFREVNMTDVFYNHELWSWLSLFYFDQLCPPDKSGYRKPLKYNLYIHPNINDPLVYRTYYRHLIAGPYRIFMQYGEVSRAILSSYPINSHPDSIEHIAAFQGLIQNSGIIEAVAKMYFEKKNGGWKPKRGLTSKNKPGNLRRLYKVINQLDMTFDVNGLNGNEIIKILPDEFSVWTRNNE